MTMESGAGPGGGERFAEADWFDGQDLRGFTRDSLIGRGSTGAVYLLRNSEDQLVRRPLPCALPCAQAWNPRNIHVHGRICGAARPCGSFTCVSPLSDSFRLERALFCARCPAIPPPVLAIP